LEERFFFGRCLIGDECCGTHIKKHSRAIGKRMQTIECEVCFYYPSDKRLESVHFFHIAIERWVKRIDEFKRHGRSAETLLFLNLRIEKTYVFPGIRRDAKLQNSSQHINVADLLNPFIPVIPLVDPAVQHGDQEVAQSSQHHESHCQPVFLSEKEPQEKWGRRHRNCKERRPGKKSKSACCKEKEEIHMRWLHQNPNARVCYQSRKEYGHGFRQHSPFKRQEHGVNAKKQRDEKSAPFV